MLTIHIHFLKSSENHHGDGGGDCSCPGWRCPGRSRKMGVETRRDWVWTIHVQDRRHNKRADVERKVQFQVTRDACRQQLPVAGPQNQGEG
jgi:hypothetical protein